MPTPILAPAPRPDELGGRVVDGADRGRVLLATAGAPNRVKGWHVGRHRPVNCVAQAKLAIRGRAPCPKRAIDQLRGPVCATGLDRRCRCRESEAVCSHRNLLTVLLVRRRRSAAPPAPRPDLSVALEG